MQYYFSILLHYVLDENIIPCTFYFKALFTNYFGDKLNDLSEIKLTSNM